MEVVSNKCDVLAFQTKAGLNTQGCFVELRQWSRLVLLFLLFKVFNPFVVPPGQTTISPKCRSGAFCCLMIDVAAFTFCLVGGVGLVTHWSCWHREAAFYFCLSLSLYFCFLPFFLFLSTQFFLFLIYFIFISSYFFFFSFSLSRSSFFCLFPICFSNTFCSTSFFSLSLHCRNLSPSLPPWMVPS